MADPTLASTQPGSEEDRSAFLSDLASAMHEKAEQAHDRLLNGLEERSAAHIDEVRARAEDEATALRDTADGDIAEIRAWSEAEIERVHDEAERRIEARRQTLAQELSNHDGLVTREIDAIQGAVDRHRDELADYFRRLQGASEPTTIARLAGSIPLAPRLDEVGATARAAAAAPAANVEAAAPAEAPEAVQPAEAAEGPTGAEAAATPMTDEAAPEAEPVAADAEPEPEPMAPVPVMAEAGPAPAEDEVVQPVAEAVATVDAGVTEPVVSDDEVAVTPERLMGVMDPQATAEVAGRPKLPPWAVRLDDLEESATSTAPAAADAIAAPAVEAASTSASSSSEDMTATSAAEPVGAVAGSEARTAEAPHGLLGSIPVLRPVGSWWNRANGNGSNGDQHEG